MAKEKAGKEVENGKVCALLSYLLIGIIWYFVDEKMKKNHFVKYHVKQGLVLLIASIIYDIVLGIIVGIIVVPLMFIGVGIALMMVVNVLYYVPLVLAIIGIINSLNGKTKELPIVGKFADKLNF